MKKSLKLTAVLLAATLMLSSCIGTFRLTNNIKDWNEGVTGNKFINELVFVAMHIVPVYPIAIFADAVVLNSIEFWTGNNPIAEAGKVQTITNAQGVEVQVAATESGYQLSSGEEQISLVYNAEERTWSAESDNQTTKLLQLTDENTANLYVGEEIVEVTLDEQGMERALMQMSLAMNN